MSTPEQENHPNYFAIIPADVRYCKDLEPNAKLLYGEITALSNREGYCWASNRYFAELYGADQRTIRRWLESLEEKGFIRKEMGEGFNPTRKIYITQAIKEKITEGQKCPGGGTKMSGGEDKNVRPHIYSNSTKEVEEERKASSAASFENIEKTCEHWTEKYGLNISPFAIKRALKLYGSDICKKVIDHMKREKPNKDIDKSKFFTSMCKDIS